MTPSENPRVYSNLRTPKACFHSKINRLTTYFPSLLPRIGILVLISFVSCVIYAQGVGLAYNQGNEGVWGWEKETESRPVRDAKNIFVVNDSMEIHRSSIRDSFFDQIHIFPNEKFDIWKSGRICSFFRVVGLIQLYFQGVVRYFMVGEICEFRAGVSPKFFTTANITRVSPSTTLAVADVTPTYARNCFCAVFFESLSVSLSMYICQIKNENLKNPITTNPTCEPNYCGFSLPLLEVASR